jgi:predicted SAM-dependent methyltransferase
MGALKVNLGSGDVPLEGFVNVDALPGAPGVDVVADISERLPFDDGSVDLIYASHVLEHFSTADVPGLLSDWRRVLRDGGTLLIAVPDLDVVARRLVELRGWFTPPHNPWLGVLYGGQKDQWDFHKTGFTAPWLAGLLTEAGFGAVAKVKAFNEVGVADTSQSPIPFGVNVSLNMRAVAGATPVPPELLRSSGVERVFNSIDTALQMGMWASTQARGRIMARRRARLEAATGASRQAR